MKTLGAAILTSALLALGAGAARPETDDPEPPPPIKVDNVRGASVKVSSGAKGPVLTITTEETKGKGKARAKVKGKGKTKARVSSFEITFSDKQVPGRLTLRFKSHEQLTHLSINDASTSVSLNTLAPREKQVVHYTAAGAPTTDEKAAALTLTAIAAKEYLEVQVEHPKGKGGFKSPWRVTWRGPVKD